MGTKRDMAREVTEWARENDNVRAVILTSSRANPDASVDELSDYDIDLIIRDREPFSDPDEWMPIFGQTMVRHPKWTMVYYLDGARIDWSLSTLEEFENWKEDTLFAYEVLLDKDGLTGDLKPPRRTLYDTQPPKESEYIEVIYRFWFMTTYVAKGLYRDELFYAKIDLHQSSLSKVLCWYVGMKTDWKTNPGTMGRWLKKHLDPDVWSEVELTFAGADLEDNWRAMFKMAELFGKLASGVGTHLGFTYPIEVDRNVTEYLSRIRDMDKKRSRQSE